MRSSLVPLLLASLVAACEVPEPPRGDGGIDDDGSACGPGVVVLSTDYQSSSAAFIRWDGEVASPHVISSGSMEPGLTAALSGDVVTPTMASGAPGTTAEIVLVDRNPASVLTWVDVASGEPTRQLSLRTGFDANAQDYVAVSEAKGYASRYQTNPEPGREPFDAGSDVVVIDPRGPTPAVVGRIGFEAVLDGEDADLTPSPSRILLAGDRLVVLLTVLSRNFQRSGDARVAVIDTTSDVVVAVHRVEGLRGCTALALAPDGARVAVGCSGTWGGSNIPTLDDAGVAVIALRDGAVVARRGAAELGAAPSSSIAFASDDALLVPTVGHEDEIGDGRTQDDRLLLVPLGGAAATALLETAPVQLGEVRCAPSCGTCLVADADRGILHRLDVDGGAVTRAGEVKVDDGIGLPPRYLGALPRAPAEERGERDR